jgi:hypothetical protein
VFTTHATCTPSHRERALGCTGEAKGQLLAGVWHMPAITRASIVHHNKHVTAAWPLHSSGGPKLPAGSYAHTQQPPTHICQVEACNLPGSAGDMLSGISQQHFDQMLLCQRHTMILRGPHLPKCENLPGALGGLCGLTGKLAR